MTTDPRDMILDTAIELWAEKGVRNVTMRELARRGGMSTGSLYRHFESKEAIVQHLYDRINTTTVERFIEGDDGSSDLATNLQRFCSLKIQQMRPHREAIPTVFAEAMYPDDDASPLSQASAQTRQLVIDLFGELVARHTAALDLGDKTPDPTDTAQVLWLLHLGVILYWVQDKTPAQANTDALISEVSGLVKLLPMAAALPGGARIHELIGALFHSQTDTAESTMTTVVEVERAVDIVVIGGGPIGSLYATFLKTLRPDTSVLVLEAHEQPGHKVGESTLSGFCKALRTVGISHELQQLLFYPKNGLGFFHVDETIPSVTEAPEYVLETFDETFQVERRVLDALIIANARRLGVDLIEGATVSLDASNLTTDGNTIDYRIGDTDHRVACTWLIDASGPAHVMAGRERLWTSDGLPFQSSSVWAYFDDVTRLADRGPYERTTLFPRDEYTQHLCLREGWVWYIPQVSWQQAPTANVVRAVEQLLAIPASALPTRDEISHRYGLPVSETTSVGLTLRADRDDRISAGGRETFARYRKQYPAFDDLLDGATIIDKPHGLRQPFQQRLDIRGYARRAVGDGWTAIGDAAFFVDPLISPGLTGGTATAWKAARATADALDAERVDVEAFTDYQRYVRELHGALERDNQLVYRSFNHPEAMVLVQRIQEIYAREKFEEGEHHDYGDDDLDVWGILAPDYQEIQHAALEILTAAEEEVGSTVPIAEQRPEDYESAVAALRALLDEQISASTHKTPFVINNARLSPRAKANDSGQKAEANL